MAIFLMLIVWFVFIVGHELSHLLVAKLFRFKTPILGIGLPFGPKFKINLGTETELRIHCLPWGGYVVIPELDAPQNSDSADTHQSSKLWQRILVVLAGIGFYFAISWFSLWAAATFIGKPIQRIVVVSLPATNTLAAQAGVKIGDQIAAIDDKQLLNIDDAVSYLSSHPGAPVVVHIKRANKSIELSVAPNPEGKAGMGLQCDGIVDYKKTGIVHATEIAN